MKKFATLLVLVAIVLPLATTLAQDDSVSGSLTIESWRNDDLVIWEDVIIPAFNEEYPNIEVIFAPVGDPAQYNAALAAKLEGGTAGDLITCRPFDQSLTQFDAGYLASLNDLSGMENFSDVAKSAWITDDGSDVFCVPMASVIHGFLYNADAFAELEIEEPTTEEEFLAALEAVKEEGGYEPLAMGTNDQWEAATMGYQNIGPNYWMGEEGRVGLIDGSAKYNEDGFLEAFEALSKWTPYLATGYQANTYPDSQNLFTLGMAAVYPAGSWDIGFFNSQVDFEMGAFKPPAPAGAENCYISDHTDIAMGLNAASENQEAGLIFLEWMTSQEFAELYTNQLPGFFTLSDHAIEVEDPLAAEFLSWRGECESTIRTAYQILSRGEPNNESDLWLMSANVLNETMTPQEAADKVQEGLETWYEPQQ
ncbi:ABC transporter substrate-binding protein [Chloroflexota bacterium]